LDKNNNQIRKLEKRSNKLNSMDTPTAEIIALGNELIIGRTVNSNATKISLELTKIGIDVIRHTTIRDEPKEIIATIKEVFSRQPNIVILTGGLGPTHDDIQIENLSKALDLELVHNDEAMDMITERYKKIGKNMSSMVSKMAKMPKGSIPLKNSEGTAPGVLLDHNKVLSISLPGVPREMMAILREEAIPLLLKRFGGREMIELGFEVYNVGETQIVPFTELVMKEYPNFHYKSHPKKIIKDTETQLWLSLHIYTLGSENMEHLKEAAELWKTNIDTLTKAVTTEIKPVFSSEFVPEE
jgi:molybdenum cofactor synthesis domain-containing protein